MCDDVDEDDEELCLELNLAVADIYYRRLQQRQVRKKLLRDYGMLDVSTTRTTQHTDGKDERSIRDALKKFLRLLKPDSYEKFVQSTLHQKQVERQILRL